jgi:hypothetical protein
MLAGKPKGKRPLERPKRRREDNTKIDIGDIWCDVADCCEI